MEDEFKIKLKEEEEYIVENYGKLSNKEIAQRLGTTPRKIINKAFHLKKKGKPIAGYSFVDWKNPKIKELLFENYGGMPTHKLAKKIGTTVPAIYRAVKKFGLGFRGYEGQYTFSELAKTLKIDEKTVRNWTKKGLKIGTYAKDGLTWIRRKRKKIKLHYALVDLDNLKKFLKKRPEAYNLNNLDQESKHLLELNRLKIFWKEKEVSCKSCNCRFWTDLYDQKPICSNPKCKKMVSKWATNYR